MGAHLKLGILEARSCAVLKSLNCQQYRCSRGVARKQYRGRVFNISAGLQWIWP